MAKRRRAKVRRKAAVTRQTITSGDRRPVFEALSVVVEATPGRDALALVRQIARRVRLNGWRVDAVTEDGTEAEIVPPRRRVGTARAWDLTYALRDQPEVAHAEPSFRYLVPENAPSRARKASSGGRTHDPATDIEYDWSLRKAGVLDAWPLFASKRPGAGVKVGHPDTGYTSHPELADPARLLVAAGYDYNDDDRDPIDDLTDDFLDNPSHGTGTGSVILSGVGSPSRGPGPFVSGAAPHAMLIPIRATESVIVFSMRNLRRAIDHATTQGAQVVSISLGGPFPSISTRRAIERAVDAGTIVLAAAGNEVGFVVFPAAFDDVIAVAASNIRDEPWPRSSHGAAVDITAPGESVWRARTERGRTGHLKFLVERGTGTSFAVATAAGVAALWVSYHGWSALTRKYGPASVARVFKMVVQATCRTPRGWKTREYGPGLVNAKKLLEARLPATSPARKMRDASRPAVATDPTGLETLVHLFPGVPRTRVEETIADLLHVETRDLPAILQNYGDELAFHLVMRAGLLDALRQQVRGGRTARAGRMAATRRLRQTGLSSRLRRQLRQR